MIVLAMLCLMSLLFLMVMTGFGISALGTKSESVLPLRAVIASYPVALLYVQTLFLWLFGPLQETWKTGAWLWFPAFAIAFFVWAEASLRAVGKKEAPPESRFWLGVCGVLCLCGSIQLAFGREEAGWSLLALHLLAVYWLICRAGCLTEGQTGPLVVLDEFAALVLYPFGGFWDRVRTLKKAAKNRKGEGASNGSTTAKNIVITVVAVLCALPLLVGAGSLLVGADADFAQFLSVLQDWRFPQISENVWEVLWRLALSLPVGAWLCGLIGRAAQAEKPAFESMAVRERAEKLRLLPGLAVRLILGAFCLLYLLFFFVKAGVLAATFSGRLPAGYTASASAREGFFQLCWVMVINFGILLCAAKLGRSPLRMTHAEKVLAVLLLMESVFLAITAAARLGLYFWMYGLTPLRILAGWGILSLSAAAVLALFSLWYARPVAKVWLMFAAVAFAVQSALQLLCIPG